HTGGEEFYVLEGTFSDQYGDFPAGTYVRNPIGSKHRPHSTDGCTIFVKLYWMHKDDQEFTRTDTLDETLWRPSQAMGLDVLPLHRFGDEENSLIRLAPAASLIGRELPGGEELFVLEGSCADENGSYQTGSWLRYPIGAAPALTSAKGCKLLVKRGHLLHPPPGPR
ncbi:MAG: cupin domain-containing protein, partial [Fimbriimonadaceae bacterium]|nr:cupin domain-containing protein [Alphaproteobacteria bacterium]